MLGLPAVGENAICPPTKRANSPGSHRRRS
uniref:Uncharacterized protein n=1 Tax=Myoviridae sp. ctdyF5 TaxID=2825144 RepID=A0A8S5U7M4_9CAUD|nr:MAG TPA: hypothetical protein [Myoviridae sp. ctdyF5]